MVGVPQRFEDRTRGGIDVLFDGSLRYAGVSCGNHPVYRYMCVVTVGRTKDGQPLRGGTAARGWFRS